VILTKENLLETGNDGEREMTQLQRDQLLFKNYLGQFCNSHA